MLYLALVSVIWAFSFGLIGSSLSGVDSFLVATLRLGVASILFLPFLRLKDIGSIDRFRLIIYGAIQFGLMYSCYMRAYQFIPSHLVAIFSILTPVYVVLIHDLCRRTFSKHYLWIAILSVLGAASIKAKTVPSGDIWMGFGLMQAAGIAFAFGQVAYRDWKRANPQVPDRSVFALLSLGGVFSVGCFSLVLTDFQAVELSTEHWKAILYLGSVASGLGFFLWNKGASLSKPGTLAAFNNAVVPIAVLFSLFLFGEADNLDTESLIRLIVGAGLIGTAVFLGQRFKIKA
ncbi:MAG: EamA family transporter [Opitutae bacterium]